MELSLDLCLTLIVFASITVAFGLTCAFVSYQTRSSKGKVGQIQLPYGIDIYLIYSKSQWIYNRSDF